jgi:hypothetical protein
LAHAMATGFLISHLKQDICKKPCGDQFSVFSFQKRHVSYLNPKP